ncbi:MAG: hypothetical protein JWP34_4879 [Massilia sp.]|nr:hypothetical protein [Massilia sp.]
MKTRLLLLGFLWVLHNNAFAQSALEPCLEDFSDAYHGGVNKVIDDAVVRPSSLQLTTFPSFYPESGLRLAGSELYFVELQSSFWGESQFIDRHGNGHMDFKRPKIIPKTRHAPINSAIARRLEHIFSKGITRAKKSDKMGLDGVSFVFSTSGGTCGWAWSPEPRSRNGRLVELMRRLEKHAMFSSPIDLQRSEKAIMRYLEVMESY